MPEPFWHLIWCSFGPICIEFGANLASNKKITAGTAPSIGDVWNKFSNKFKAKSTLFNANKV